MGLTPLYTALTVLPDGDLNKYAMSYSGGYLNAITESYTDPGSGSTGTRETDYAYDDTVTIYDAYSHPIYQYNRPTSINPPGGNVLYISYPSDTEIDQSDDAGTTQYFYNARHQLAGIQHANGLTTTNLYDGSGFLSQSIDLQSHATNTFTFANGLPATRTTPLGVTLTYYWDHLDRLTGIGFSDGSSISNVWDKLNIVARKDRLNNWTYATFDTMRQLSSATDARGNTSYYYYCFCGGLASVTDPLSNTTTYNRDYDGNVTSVVGSDGFTTTYTRNLIGQVTNLANSAGLNLTYAYNNQGLVTNVSSTCGTVFSVLYDTADRPIQTTDAQGVSVTNQFDTMARLTDRWNAYGKILHNDYSAQGIYQHYDALNHLTQYGYDAAGRLEAVTNANGEITGFTYNPLGELATLTDGNGHTTSWTYDPYGRSIAKTDGNGVLIETNGYNPKGWTTAHWTPAKGLTTYSYDDNGNLTGITYSSGTNITVGYDALNRLTYMHDAVGNTTNNYVNYGAFEGALASAGGLWPSDLVSYSYANHLVTALNLLQPSGHWTESYGYDGMLRLNSLTSQAGNFTYNYNGAGRQINQLVLPGTGNEIDYTYDGAGSLTGTALKHSGTVLDGYTYTYDANGNRTSLTRGDGTQVNYGCDNISQLTSATGYEPDGVTQRANENFGYVFDAAGNLMMRTNNTLVQTFSTDGANQLTSVTRNNSLLTVAGSLNGSNNFTMNGQPAIIYHDNTFAATNIINNGLNVFTAIATSNSVTMTNSISQVLPTTVNIAYDANGNLISDGLHGYDYDCANELTRVTITNVLKAEFTYDGYGRRRINKEFAWQTNAWFETNEVHYIYDGMTAIQERNSNNVPEVSYTRGTDLSGNMQNAGGIGGLLARTDASGSTYYHCDGNGNVTMLISNSGAILAKYLYDPYGNILGMWGTFASANTYRFSSKEYEPDSGLYYYGYRFYDPNKQRWLNRDPIGEFGGINVYNYIRNNPINLVDNLGLDVYLVSSHPFSPSQEGTYGPYTQFLYSAPGPNVFQLDPEPDPENPVHPQDGGIDPDDGVFSCAAPELPIIRDAMGAVAGFIGDAVGNLMEKLGPSKSKCPAKGMSQLGKEGQALLDQEEQLNNALNEASANVLKAMQQVDSATTPAQYAAAQEQAEAANLAYQNALNAWENFFNQQGH